MTFTPRGYQEAIVQTAKQYNTLVVLPTGLGKTAIAMMLAQHRIQQHPNKKILFVAPTKPLVEQHHTSFAQYLPDAETLGVTLTGRTPPKKRAKQFSDATYIFSTPQTIENDLLAGRITLTDVCLLVLDEAHRATGDYAYVGIASEYEKQATNQRILALTASPGSKKEDVQEIVTNCFIEQLEVRSLDDPDVTEYVQELDVTYVEVTLPNEFVQVQQTLARVLDNRNKQLLSTGLVKKEPRTKGELLGVQKTLQHEIRSGKPDPAVWRSISLIAEILKAQHAQELLETQGLQALNTYLEGLERQARKGQSKAVSNLLQDVDMRHVIIKSKELDKRGLEHPKFVKLLSIIKLERVKNPDSKIIVFSQYRDMASLIAKNLNEARLFVGQQKKGETGLSQKEQQAMLEEFRAGEFHVLVATAVGEEGLDIPQVDLVVFYEPVPSAIRTIQRRGRTGRHDTGRVHVLVTKDTRDEAYRWVAFHKEKRMYRTLKDIEKTITPKAPSAQTTLETTSEEEVVEIVADSREKASGVLKQLKKLNVHLTLQALPVGDYVLSKRVCVEFKYQDDFVDSLLDGRLFSQLRELVQYQKPIVMVQGSDWYSQRNVHPNAIRGALSAIAVSFGVPILVTQNDEDSARMLLLIAQREAKGGISQAVTQSVRASTKNQELFSLVASIPSVGPVLAPKLLAHFLTVHNIVTASEQDLLAVEGVGKKKARSIKEFFSTRYE
ncbi:MAG: DEAD/DEAH box helicase [Candidatus Woesearchaeota archaeon]